LNENSLKEIVRKCYQKYLNRESDKEGLQHYLAQLKSGSITPSELESIFKNSFEYKLSHPVDYDSNVPVEEKMKKDWDARAKMNMMFVISTDHSDDEDDFWESGLIDAETILGQNNSRFEKIISNNDPKNMKVLEIGCGIGRLLVPMSKIFGKVIGIDVSSEMVTIGQKKLSSIPNCKILENNGVDLREFDDNSFDFCYSFIVFQHIPDKKIIENYIKEVSRILKPGSIFRFQIRGTISSKPKEITTWDGVQFTSTEIHQLAQKNNFEIVEESNDTEEYYWLTFKSTK